MVVDATGEKEDWSVDAAAAEYWSSWLSIEGRWIKDEDGRKKAATEQRLLQIDERRLLVITDVGGREPDVREKVAGQFVALIPC